MAKIIVQFLKDINLYKLILIILLGLFGSIVILKLTIQNGAGITPDSVAYLSVARNYADSNTFITYNGSDLILQPPLYPIILAMIKKITLVDPQISSGYVNAIFFGLIIFLSGLILLKHLSSFTLVIFGSISIMISYALVQTSLLILSEPLFILLILLFLFHLEKFRINKDYASLFLLSLWASLACLTRYAGVILILTGIIFVLFQQKSNFKKRIIQSILFISITVLPIGSWIIRNYFISGTPTGQRAISSYSLYQNLVFFYDTLLSWYLPVNSIINFIIIFILLIEGWIILKSNIDKPFNKINQNKILHVLLFVLFYSCFIIISSTTTAYDRISDRLLSPIYIPLIFILFFLMDKIFNWLSDRFNKLLIKVLLTFCFISFIRFPLYSTLYIIQEFNCRTGVGYNTSAWTNSKTIEFLLQDKSIAERYKLYSNEPEILYFLTKLKSEYSPVKTFYNSHQLLSGEQNNNYINQNIKNGYLIWFSSSNRSFLFTINELHKNYELTEIESFDDGVIYTFN